MKTFHTKFGVSMISPNCAVLLGKTAILFFNNLDLRFKLPNSDNFCDNGDGWKWMDGWILDGNKILLICMATLI